MRVYKLNDIPCIYFYPENLGIIDYLFDMRIRKELSKRPRTKKEYLKYKWDCLLKDRKDLFFWMILSIIMLVGGIFDSDKELFVQYMIFFTLVFCHQVFRLIEGYKKYVHEGKNN